MCFEYFHICLPGLFSFYGFNKKNSLVRKYLHVVAKEDPQARTVVGQVLSTVVYNFKRVFPLSLLLVFREHFTDVHLKTAKMIAFDDAPYIQ